MATRRPLVLVGGELKELPAGDTISPSLVGATTVGAGLLSIPNPSALRFLRLNADNTVSALAAADFRSAIGAGTSSFDGAFSSLSGKPTTLSGYGISDAQGLDSDLTALAGLSTTGLVARTGSGTAAARTITGTADQVIVANGDGVSGNPTLALPQSIATTSTPTFGQLRIGNSDSPDAMVYARSIADASVLHLHMSKNNGGSSSAFILEDDRGYSGPNTGTTLLVKSWQYAGDSNEALANFVTYVGGSPISRFYINNANGNVGIGTTTPDSSFASRSVLDIANNGLLQVRTSDNASQGYFFASSGSIAVGSRTADPLILRTGAAERMRIDTTGNVGIGTTSPAAKLAVATDVVGSNNIGITIDGYAAPILQLGSRTGEAVIGSNNFANSPIVFKTGMTAANFSTGTERMRIDYTGNVGIGTIAPTARLDVSVASAPQAAAVNLIAGGGLSSVGDGAAISFLHTNSERTYRIYSYATGENAGSLRFARGTNVGYTDTLTLDSNGNVGIGTTSPSAKLSVSGSSYLDGATTIRPAAGAKFDFTTEGGDSYGTLAVTNTGGNYAGTMLRTSNLTIANAASEQVRIVGSLIYARRLGAAGENSLSLETNNAARLTLSAIGGVRLNAYGAGTLITDSSGNITASSDRRLKNVSGKFTRGLAAIMEIQPKVFTWKPESGMNTDDVNVGFIAQDVQGAIPEAVGSMKTSDVEEDDSTGKKVKKSKREASEFLTLSDRPIIAALVNAVQELSAQIETLKKAKLSQ